MEFKGTSGEWKIVEKGNTVKQLCIQVDDDNKVCGNISPKRMEDALLIKEAPEMFKELQNCKMDFQFLWSEIKTANKTNSKWDVAFELVEKRINKLDSLISKATEI